MKSFTVDSKQEYIKTFNGQRCSYDDTKESVLGVSGKTRLYNLAMGGGLYLADDEVKPLP